MVLMNHPDSAPATVGEPDVPAGKIRLKKNPRGFFDPGLAQGEQTNLIKKVFYRVPEPLFLYQGQRITH
jgi:hypothetical protein